MPQLELPDGSVVDVTPPTQAEEALLGQLSNIAKLLDILVRLECGVIKRKDLREDIEQAEAAIRDHQKNAIEEAAEAEFKRLLDEQQDEEARASVALDGETQVVEAETNAEMDLDVGPAFE
jgi:hypothetical protein